MDFCFDVIVPLSNIVIFIVIIIAIGVLVREFLPKRNNSYIHECCACNSVEDSDTDMIQKAIVIIGDEKIEVEVVDYKIDDNIVKLQSIDGKVCITGIKNFLLMSDSVGIENILIV
ncbi:MAG: hypothetical protein NSGCLCUN01_01312 [uncultured Clostridium sp.]